MWGVSLRHPILASFYAGSCLAYPVLTFLGSFSYTSRVCFFFLFSWEFLLLIPCWLHFYLGGFSYTSRAGFSFINWPSLTHPMLVLYLPGEFLLHIPCCLHFYAGSFSYTSRAGFPFYQLRFSYTSNAGFIFIWGVFLTHPLLALFFCGEFLWHIPWRFFF